MQTPFIQAEPLTGYTAIRNLLPTELKDVDLLTTLTLFNIVQAQFGSVYYQLLSPDEYTIRIHKEVAAYKLWRSRNDNRFPDGAEWKELIPEIQNTVIDNMNMLPKLYVPFIDPEIVYRENSVFAYEVNNQIPDWIYFRDVTTALKTYLQPDFHCRLILSKIVRHPSITVNHENIDRGYSLNCDQRLFLAACFENIRLMFFGSFLCMSCSKSFAQRCDFKIHIKVFIY